MARVAVLVVGLLMVAGAQAKDIEDNSQAASSGDAIGKHTNQFAGSDASKSSVKDYSKFFFPSALSRNHGVSPAASKTFATQPGASMVNDGAAMHAQDSMSFMVKGLLCA